LSENGECTREGANGRNRINEIKERKLPREGGSRRGEGENRNRYAK
jgi:hypothetical protein